MATIKYPQMVKVLSCVCEAMSKSRKLANAIIIAKLDKTMDVFERNQERYNKAVAGLTISKVK